MLALKVVHSAAPVNASVLHRTLHAARVVHQMTRGLSSDAVPIAAAIEAAAADRRTRLVILRALRRMGVDVLETCRTIALLDRARGEIKDRPAARRA